MESQTTAVPRLTKLQLAILFFGLALFAWAILYRAGNESARQWALLGPSLGFTMPVLWVVDWVLRRRRRKAAAR